MLGINFSLRNQNQTSGFTYIEIAVVVSIFLVLLTLTGVSIGPLIPRASLSTSEEVLKTDLALQQIQSMNGVLNDSATSSNHGIYFDGTSYFLFRGPTYDPADSYTREVVLADGVTVSTTASGNQIIFAEGNGSLTPLTIETITLSDNRTSQSIQLTVNQWGVVE